MVQPLGGLRAPPPYRTRGPRHGLGAAGGPPRYLQLEIFFLILSPCWHIFIYSLIVFDFIVYRLPHFIDMSIALLFAAYCLYLLFLRV
jgi:hypothetical protein